MRRVQKTWFLVPSLGLSKIQFIKLAQNSYQLKAENAVKGMVLEQDPRRRMSAEEWHAHFEAMDRFAAHFDDVTPKELEAEITEAIATVRVEERATFASSLWSSFLGSWC